MIDSGGITWEVRVKTLLCCLALTACIEPAPAPSVGPVAMPALDARCVAFARDYCGAWMRLLPEGGYALGSGEDAPLQVDESETCAAQIIDGWHYRAAGDLRVLGKCDEVLEVDVGGCMNALGAVGEPATIDGLNAMMLACTRVSR